MPLTQDFTDETPLLQERCATRLRQGIVSSFVPRGRAGLPATPDGFLSTRLYTRATVHRSTQTIADHAVLDIHRDMGWDERVCQ